MLERIYAKTVRYCQDCLVQDLYEFEKWLRFNNYSDNTIIAHFRDIKLCIQILATKSKEFITSEVFITLDLSTYRYILSDICNKSAATQERVIVSLKKWLLFKTQTTTGAIEKLKYPKKSEHLFVPASIEAIKSLIDSYTSNSIYELRNKTMIMLLYTTGMRVNEALNLRWTDIGTNHCKIMSGKGRKTRHVPLLEEMVVMLKDYANFLQSKKGEFVFIGERCAKWHACSVAKHLRTKAKQLGIANINPHGLRHACATHLIQSGCNLRSVQALLGHTNLETTKGYIKHDYDALASMHAKIMNKQITCG